MAKDQRDVCALIFPLDVTKVVCHALDDLRNTLDTLAVGAGERLHDWWILCNQEVTPNYTKKGASQCALFN
jgi:hypothetical protein